MFDLRAYSTGVSVTIYRYARISRNSGRKFDVNRCAGIFNCLSGMYHLKRVFYRLAMGNSGEFPAHDVVETFFCSLVFGFFQFSKSVVFRREF